MRKFIFMDYAMENDMSRARQRGSDPVQTLKDNLGVGAAVGAVGFIINYVLMYLFITIDGAETGDEGWKLVGNVLYNAQFVDSELSGGGMSISFNLITDSGSDIASTIPSFVYNLGPIIVLVAVGFFVAQQAQAMDIGSSVAAAVSIVPGTLVLSIVGIFLFEYSEQGASAGPELMMGILFVGILLPAFAGAIGGAIADQV